MMNFIRTKLKFLMWFVAIAFVAGLFFVGGRAVGQNWLTNIMPLWLLVQMPGCARSAGIIMKIDSYNVKIDEYKRIRENTIALAQQQYGENFETYAANIDFGVRAMESIIKYAVLLQEAEKRDIYVSRIEIEEAKRAFPYWVPIEARSRVMPYPYYSMSRREGKFDPKSYSYALGVYGKITPKDFAVEVENSLRIARLKDLLSQSSLVTDLEIQQEYKKQNEKAMIKYVEFRKRDFTDEIEITDAEVSDFFQENMLNYKTKDKVNVSFIKIDPNELARNIKIDPFRVANYYKNRQKDYSVPEKVKVHHILVEIEPGTSAEDKAKAKAYAGEILVEAKKPGADFSALAESYNKEPFKVKYEDITRPFERGKMEPAFEKVAFTLPPGEISDVVETSYGYHVLQVQDKTPARIKALAEVQAQIVKTLKDEQAVQEARQKADDIQYDVMAEQDLQIAVDANPDLNLNIMETGFFAKGDPIPNMGAYYTHRNVADEAFKLKMGEISNLVEVKTTNNVINGYYILKLIGKKPGGLPKLKDVKDDIIDDLKDEKSPALAMEAAKKVMAERDPADDLDKLAEKNELRISESESFAISEDGYIKGKSFSLTSKAIMLKAFSMKVGEIAGPFEGQNGAYIIQLVERQEFDSKKFAEAKEEKKELRNQILQQKQQKTFDTWYQKVRSEAQVKSFSAGNS